MKANELSLGVKIAGVVLVFLAVILNGFGIWSIGMGEIGIAVGLLQVLVTPIDISKIKEAGHAKD